MVVLEGMAVIVVDRRFSVVLALALVEDEVDSASEADVLSEADSELEEVDSDEDDSEVLDIEVLDSEVEDSASEVDEAEASDVEVLDDSVVLASIVAVTSLMDEAKLSPGTNRPDPSMYPSPVIVTPPTVVVRVSTWVIACPLD